MISFVHHPSLGCCRDNQLRVGSGRNYIRTGLALSRGNSSVTKIQQMPSGHMGRDARKGSQINDAIDRRA